MAHLDIKPDNILIDDDLQLKLLDFGSSESISATNIDHWVSTVNYAPPEVLDIAGQRYKTGLGKPFAAGPVDIFNIGTTLFTLIAQVFPFNIDCNNSNPMNDNVYQTLYKRDEKNIQKNSFFNHHKNNIYN